MKRKKEEIRWNEFKIEIIISVIIASFLGYRSSRFVSDMISLDNEFISFVSSIITFLVVTWLIGLVVLAIEIFCEFIFEKIVRPKK